MLQRISAASRWICGPLLALSAPSIAQGARRRCMGGFPAGAYARAQCELGPVWFTAPRRAGWAFSCYLQRRAGRVSLTRHLGGYTPANLTVEPRLGQSDAGPGGLSRRGQTSSSAPSGALQPRSGDPWNGAFSVPVSGDTLRPTAHIYIAKTAPSPAGRPASAISAAKIAGWARLPRAAWPMRGSWRSPAAPWSWITAAA